MREERLDKRFYRANVEGNGGRRKMKRRWRDIMKKLLMRRRLSEREGMERMRAKIYGGRKRVEITRTFVCK